MFAALRDYFSRPEEEASRRGRGRRLGALFAFEFVVVVLGVLAAQLLQDWFSQRSEARRADEAVAELHKELRSLRSIAEYRIRANTCENERIASFTALAQSGGSIAPECLAPPIMPMPSITAWSDNSRSAVMCHAGEKEVKLYDSFGLLARMMSERQRLLEDQWADFRLLSTGSGARSADGRTALLLASARAGGLLDAIDSNAFRVTQMLPKPKEMTEVLKQMAAMKHPCAGAALVPYKPPEQ